MDTTEYLDVFIDESTEHLDVLSKNLLKLEKNPSETALLEEIFRAAHTLKGMSATMGFQDLANLTHRLENVLDSIRNDELRIDADMMDVLFAALDALNNMVGNIAAGGDGKNDVSTIVDQLVTIGSIEPESEVINHKSMEGAQEQAARFFTKLDEFEQSILDESKERGFFNYEISVQLQKDCLLKGARVFMVFEVLEKFGEVIKSLPTVSELEEEKFDHSFIVLLVSNFNKADIEAGIHKVSEVHSVEVRKFGSTGVRNIPMPDETPANKPDEKTRQEVASTDTSGKNVVNKTIRVNIERLDSLMNLFEELIIDRGRLEQISDDLQHPELTETVEKISRVSSDLQNMILTMRMVPIDRVFSRFPRMIRQLARELEKEIAIDIIGADTELDRTVIDEIGDPLVHMIRNAIDHGIESPKERIKQHKPKEGILKLTAYHSGNSVFIEISDDGAGIDKEKVI
ncbi:MAG TPA: chemotaxis protein CheA, partial [Bacillota bacterium]|nr:chemotaxis protein CheA [Bacillota bacterium]